MTSQKAERYDPQSALEKWRGMYGDELAEVDRVILSLSQSDSALIPQLVQHIIASGGKRLRPIMVILAAKLCGYEGGRQVNLAAAIEFLHTATLLHDDVVDGSELRRGEQTANNLWGNAPSVLVGDFLLSRGFQLMARDGSLEVLRILSDTSATITEGEVQQLQAVNDITTDEETYIEIITAKTAALFAAACQIGGVVADRPMDEQQALRDFGENLGIAFQIADDALDYSARQEALGKTIGDDFREGKVTLPVILAYGRGDEEERAFWLRAMEGEQREGDLAQALEIMARHEVIAQTMGRAGLYVDRAKGALSIFEKSDVRTAMLELLEFSVEREY